MPSRLLVPLAPFVLALQLPDPGGLLPEAPVRGEGGLDVSAERYGCGVNAGTLSFEVDTRERQVVFALDAPLPRDRSPVAAFLSVSTRPDPLFPCGSWVRRGASGPVQELLVEEPLLWLDGAPWSGPGYPAWVPLTVPPELGASNESLFVQGVLLDRGHAGDLGLVLTDAAKLSLGSPPTARLTPANRPEHGFLSPGTEAGTVTVTLNVVDDESCSPPGVVLTREAVSGFAADASSGSLTLSFKPGGPGTPGEGDPNQVRVQGALVGDADCEQCKEGVEYPFSLCVFKDSRTAVKILACGIEWEVVPVQPWGQLVGGPYTTSTACPD